MYEATYMHYGNARTDTIEAESYSHAQAIARKIYREQLTGIKRIG